MAEPQGWTPVTPRAAAPSGWTPVTPVAATPDFRTTNERDEAGNPTVADAVGATWDWANRPLIPQIADAAHAIREHLDAPALTRSKTVAQILGFVAGATGAAGDVAASFTSPLGLALTVAGVGPEGAAAKSIPGLKGLLELPAVARLQRAMQVAGGAGFAAQGAHEVATAPTVGGKLAGVAQMAGGGAGVLGGLAPRAGSAAAPAAPRLSVAEEASNAFARTAGIPLDAATATANPAVAGAQKMVGHTIGGSIPAGTFKAAQNAALTRVGRELAADVHPVAMTPETAGAAAQGRLQAATQAEEAARAAESAMLAADVHPVAMTPETAGAAAQGRIQGSMRTFGDLATEHYDALRAIEADPASAERVHTAPAGSPAFRSILGKLRYGVESAVSDANPEIQTWARSVGERGPTPDELTVMRQIEAELDAQPYTPYLLRPGKYGSSLEHVEGTGGAGAPVYDDILQAAPGSAQMTRAEVQGAIAKTLETGEWSNASRGAFKVAQDRLASSGQLTGPTLDPGAPLLGGTTQMGLPVQVGKYMARLEPLYQRLSREAEFARRTNTPMSADKARAFAALDGLMHGPDVAPVSVVDAALGELKSLARADLPELRTAGQGVAAQAVQQLSAAVDAAVAKAGPQAVEALERGRQATRAKYEAVDIYKGLRDEPVGTFRRLTQPGDAGIEFLRQFSEHAPESLPELGRAKLTEWADLTPERRLAAWQALGPETKRRLFGTEARAARVEDVLTRATQHDAGAVYGRLRQEPVGSYRQLTAPKDAGIAFLRDVQRHAPDSLPEIGRAKLEEWLTRATEAGTFQHADRIYAEWQALGPETKRALFGGPIQVQRLDQFFTLAKRIAQNPNPSGTAHTLALGAQAGTLLHAFSNPLGVVLPQAGGYALAKLLYTPQGVALINRALSLSMKAPTVSGAAAARAAWATVASAARARPAAAGPRAVPLVADRDPAD